MAVYNLGEAYYGQGKWEAAGRQFASALRALPQSKMTPSTRLLYALCLINLKRNVAGQAVPRIHRRTSPRAPGQGRGRATEETLVERPVRKGHREAAPPSRSLPWPPASRSPLGPQRLHQPCRLLRRVRPSPGPAPSRPTTRPRSGRGHGQQTHGVVREDLMFSRYFKIIEDGPRFDGNNLKAITRDWKLRGAGWVLTVKTAARCRGARPADQPHGLFDQPRIRRAGLRPLLPAGCPVLALARPPRLRRPGEGPDREDRHRPLPARLLQQPDREQGGPPRGLRRSQPPPPDHAPRHHAPARISPDRKSVAYTSYKDSNPDLFLMDLGTGKAKALSNDQGLTW